MVTTEEPRTTTPTTTLKSCDCGKYSHSCYLDTMDRKLCLCHFGYVQMNGYCYATTTTSMVTTEEPSTTAPTTTLRVCECGKYSHSCYLDTMDRKLSAATLLWSLLKSQEQRRLRQSLRDCYCGINSRSCISWFGRKICDCYAGYDQVDGYRLGNQMLWRVIQVSLTGALLIVLMGMFCFWCRMKK
ncbi:hypothetical protein CEXT_620722 [Caerostris extrusa]|uniref:Uncharacterized protein n=1 Tax=Caerostris extrusa TaxID=172846 RepID=A0AAV4WFK3_CAEEX|nr:hypothetical protein CEXT_620722 [Caerostris extrusa]